MGITANQPLPRKREGQLLWQEIGGELLVYDGGTHQAFCLNQTAHRVWQQCDGITTLEQAVVALRQGGDGRADYELVLDALEQLADAGLLAPTFLHNAGRRDALRKLALGAGAMITSIVVPPAAAALSCFPLNHACTASSQCCPPLSCVLGHCL
jgi:hypothetical protein